MRAGWLLCDIIALQAAQCFAMPTANQMPLRLDGFSENNSGGDESIKVPGKTNAHFVGNPKDDILVIDSFDDKVMNRYDTTYSFDLKGNILEDAGAARLRLTATWRFFNNGEEEAHDEERPICEWEFDWLQDGKNTCELKAGDLFVKEHDIEFPPFSVGPNSSLSIRAQLWTEDDRKMTDFESTIFVDHGGEDDRAPSNIDQ